MKIRQTRSPESYVYSTLSPFTVWVIKKRQRTAAVVVRETADDVEARRWEKLPYFPIFTAEDLIRENFSTCYFDCAANIRRCIVSTGSE